MERWLTLVVAVLIVNMASIVVGMLAVIIMVLCER